METFVARLKTQLFAVRGRAAKPASTRYNLLKTLGQTLAMWTVFLAIGPLIAFAIEDFTGLVRFRFAWRGQTLIGAVLFLLGWLIAWTSAYFMVTRGDGTPLPVDSTRKLVVAGPYRWVRNPMAFASLAQGGAIGLIAGSPLVLAYIFAGAWMWNHLARPWEEHDLERKFGAEYARYKREVRCWIPRFKPYSASLEASFWNTDERDKHR
ncbi:MAG TPA: isoprenylcysteine carboxylmethyltransferase family protein [Abditibacterium sp.]|jgi:protein-S-isoprenylcysteine O-methyltransferase Ste14